MSHNDNCLKPYPRPVQILAEVASRYLFSHRTCKEDHGEAIDKPRKVWQSVVTHYNVLHQNKTPLVGVSGGIPPGTFEPTNSQLFRARSDFCSPL